MTADERLALVRVKVERAKKHLVELSDVLRAFFESNPYEVIPKADPNTGHLSYYVSKVTPVPVEVSAIAGEIVQSIRSALDHLVQQLYFVGSNTDVRNANLYFPTDSSPTQYKASVAGKIKGLRQDAVDAINSIEPYDGGKGADFSIINRLNRIDKHCLLVTVASISQGPNIMQDVLMALGFKNPPFFLTSFDEKTGPAKVGDKIHFSSDGKSEADKNRQFIFQVVIHEPGVIEGKPLLETLQHYTDLVSNTVELFKPCLS